MLTAVVLHAMAFIIWDVGSRPPTQLLDDVRKAFAFGTPDSLRRLRSGLWRFALGWAVLLAGATLMLSVTVVHIRTEFMILESIAVVAGLLIEMLVGARLRSRLFD